MSKRWKKKGKNMTQPVNTQTQQPVLATVPVSSVDGAQGPPVQQSASRPAPPQADFVWKVHPYTNEYIRFADTKAAAVIAWSAALIGILFALKAHQRFMRGMVFTGIDWGATLLGGLSLLAFLLLAFAVGAAFWCVKPSLWSRDGNRTHEPGYIYWGQVRAHQSPEAFKAGLAQQTQEQLMAHCADHVYVLAGIAKRKYWWVDWSIRLAILGTLFAGIVALFAQ
jgi:Family of unknown function (DUF5706)